MGERQIAAYSCEEIIARKAAIDGYSPKPALSRISSTWPGIKLDVTRPHWRQGGD